MGMNDPIRPMTAAAFNAALEKLGWTQAYLARRLKVHPNTVLAWAKGRSHVPGYAEEHLRIAKLAQRILHKDVS